MGYEETIHYKGYTIKLIADEDATSPDEWEDPAVVMVTTRNRYFEHIPDGWDIDEVGEQSKQVGDFRVYEHGGIKWRVYPLYMYAHSGVALSVSRGGQFSDPWDSGQVGFLCINPKELKNNRGSVSLDAAKGYVETWNQYLCGDVWGYVVTQPDDSIECTCDPDEDDECARHADEAEQIELDSCWGMYGKDYCQKEAQAVVDGRRTKVEKLQSNAI